MTKASRMYDIILGAQNGKPIEEFEPPLNKEEIVQYNSTLEEVRKWRAQGIEPIFELPIDAFDDDEDIENIYPSDFDDKVMSMVKLENRKIKHIRSVE